MAAGAARPRSPAWAGGPASQTPPRVLRAGASVPRRLLAAGLGPSSVASSQLLRWCPHDMTAAVPGAGDLSEREIVLGTVRCFITYPEVTCHHF